MAIKEKFGQAVIGSAVEDAEQTLIQIHRPEINIVSAYRSQDPAIEHYLHGLDIENRYMRPTEDNPNPEYGVVPAFFYYKAHEHELVIGSGDVPNGEGREQFLSHLKNGARIYSQVTGFDDVQVMWRVLGEAKEGLVCHMGINYIRLSKTMCGLSRLIGII